MPGTKYKFSCGDKSGESVVQAANVAAPAKAITPVRVKATIFSYPPPLFNLVNLNRHRGYVRLVQTRPVKFYSVCGKLIACGLHLATCIDVNKNFTFAVRYRITYNFTARRMGNDFSPCKNGVIFADFNNIFIEIQYRVFVLRLLGYARKLSVSARPRS